MKVENYPDNLPGQMTIYDFPEYLPGGGNAIYKVEKNRKPTKRNRTAWKRKDNHRGKRKADTMNKERRKSISKALQMIEEAREILEEVQEEEQEAYDNLPEGLQGSERGEAMEEAADALSEVTSSLEDITSSLEDL